MDQPTLPETYREVEPGATRRWSAGRQWLLLRYALIAGWVALLGSLPLVAERAPGGDDDLFGFQTPWALAIAGVVLTLGTLVLLIGGPEPWRATRWAWFWWMRNPFGLAAFLLFSGPAFGLPRPRDLERRLTGGWSFLLAFVVSMLTVTLWGVRLQF